MYGYWKTNMPTGSTPAFDGGATVNLLGTCRAVCDEVLGLYYDFESINLYQFSVSRTQATESSINVIRFRYDAWDPWAFDALYELSRLPILKELRICARDRYSSTRLIRKWRKQTSILLVYRTNAIFLYLYSCNILRREMTPRKPSCCHF